MIILDYGSGTPDRAREVWYNPQTIEIIRHYTRAQVEILTVTAFDPIENREQGDRPTVRVLNPPQFQFLEKNDSIILDYTSDVAGIPESIDVITVLHPSPAVILDYPFMGIETYLSHIPELLKTIKDKMTPRGHIFLQLDYHYRRMEERFFGAESQSRGFVSIMNNSGLVTETTSPEVTDGLFFPAAGKYDRLSLHVFKKNN